MNYRVLSVNLRGVCVCACMSHVREDGMEGAGWRGLWVLKLFSWSKCERWYRYQTSTGCWTSRAWRPLRQGRCVDLSVEKSEESLRLCHDNLDDQWLRSVVVVGVWVDHFDSEISRSSSFCQFQCSFSDQNTNMTFHICKLLALTVNQLRSRYI
jgi:hypothetical protein